MVFFQSIILMLAILFTYMYLDMWIIRLRDKDNVVTPAESVIFGLMTGNWCVLFLLTHSS